MEYAKDEIFNIHYDTKKGTIECGTSKKKGLKKFLKQYKLLSTFLILGITFSVINCVLIWDFFKILSSM